MKRKIFFKILALTALSLILLFLAVVIITYSHSKRLVRERLETETGLVEKLLNSAGEYEVFEAYRNNDELRVTVVSLTGEVLFESDTHAEIGENHLGREEIEYALAGTPQAVERYSETFACEMSYYAVKTTVDDGTEVVVRLAVKSSEITSYFLSSLPFLLFSLLAAMLVALTLASKLSKSVSDKIGEVANSLKSLNDGEYIPLKTNTKEPEFFAVFNEINECNAKAYEAKLREEYEREKLNAVLSRVSQGIVALDGKDTIVFANDSALRLFDGSVTGEGNSLAYLIADTRLCKRILTEKGENFSFEERFRDTVLNVTGKTLTNTTGMSKLLIFTDVTAEKEIVRQKSDFFANASHELKTPITVMRGLAELLLQTEGLPEKERKQIERIHKESLRLTSLISDMLKISKLERGDEEEERAAVDLSALANEVVSELTVAIQKKNLQVSVTGAGTVTADNKSIYELMQNLVSNAVNYNKENGWLNVAIEDREQTVVLCVEDGGIGVEKEHLPRLCERFYRVDKSRSKKTGGTGLGLAIVKHVCARYNADLKIESEIDEGTRITVTFKKA